jgi:hypothetical protein
MTNSDWELTEVGNEGSLVGSIDSQDVVVPTKTLITDMKAQLMFLPRNFTWTVGWRTYVWRKKETGQFKELTEEEYKTLLSVGTVNYTRDGGGSDTGSEHSTGTEGNSTE